MKYASYVLTWILVAVLLLSAVGCNGEIQSSDLMNGIRPQGGNGKNSDEAFLNHQWALSLELFSQSVQKSRKNNVLISPLSIQLALTMTANGAKGNTLSEMESVLGGTIPLSDLNAYLKSYSKNLPQGEKYKLNIANSIWFRDEEDRLTVEQDFLQKNADCFGAQIYKSAFDNQTLKDINLWVSENTDGMIDKILDEIHPDAVMYLINALVFDAEWEKVYDKSSVRDGVFTDINGIRQNATMMHSEESIYLEDGKATGFVKQYKDRKYSFAVLLPNTNVDLYDYINGLTAEELQNTLNNRQTTTVFATMPKFSYQYELSMNTALAELGMPTAFSPQNADFSALGKSTRGNLYISDVLHKTFISVDELGTKAGAVTMVEMRDEAAPMDPKTVVLDRPFIFMILDNTTNLPVFIGVLTSLPQ